MFFFARTWLGLIGFFLAVGLPACRQQSQSSQLQLVTTPVAINHETSILPNIVFITIDTLRADRVGAYGHPLPISPVLDSLSRVSAVFSDLRCPMPATNPSHASMMSGLYPFGHGSLVNGQPIRTDIPLMAELLNQNGYSTAAVISSAVLSGRLSGLNRGFDFYHDQKETRPDQAASRIHSVKTPRKQNIVLDFAFGDISRDNKVVPFEQTADETTHIAIDWLKSHTESPFFMWLHYFDPHSGYLPPDPFNKVFAGDYAPQGEHLLMSRMRHNKTWTYEAWCRNNAFVAQYDGEVRFTDQQIGRLLQFLSSTNLLKNTWIVIVADHGESLGEYDGYVGHGAELNDSSIHIPLLMTGGRFGSRIIPDAVQIMDCFPTLMKMLGIGIPASIDGRDLEPLISRPGQMPAGKQRFHTPVIRSDTSMKAGSVWNSRKTICTYDIENLKTADCRMFNLQTDPFERYPVDAAMAVGPAQSQQSDLNDWLRTWSSLSRISQKDLDPKDLEALKALGYFDGDSSSETQSVGSESGS